jgi:hypothetical protein
MQLNHYLILAKAKLESQLELARAQETANGGQASDVMKRVRIITDTNQYLFLFFLEYNS